MRKRRVGVVYGGRSGEHEVSVASAASIFKHLDRAKYEAVPILIEKSGRWTLGGTIPQALSAAAVLEEQPSTLRQAQDRPEPSREMTVAQVAPSHVEGQRTEALRIVEPSAAVAATGVDVVFPVLHGPYGEDGTVQGLLELANVAYVGAGVLGSAAGMDKAVMKTLFAATGLPIVAHLVALRREWERDAPAITGRVSDTLHYPVFVKPANLGSSVGISKARSDQEFAVAMELALQFDRKIVIEAAVPDAREIECAVLGNDEPQASVVGEIIPSREFYDYEAKYLDAASELLIPAPLGARHTAEIQRLAVDAFRAVEGAGMTRVDFLMARATEEIFVNEVNTIPGFTTISMYPKLWEASGLPYSALLDRLIELALERHAEKQQLRTSIT
ncbi:MAG: D-alanine--D-alanine ligase family protein [Vicinamibacterales bacterium]